MAKEKKQNEQAQEPEIEETVQETAGTAEETVEAPAEPSDALEQALAAEQDKYLRLLAEYDNYRKRSQKEKDQLYTELRAEIVGKFLPVYDNLERALHQETTDEAYKKGVEMTMTGLTEVLEKLGVETFGAVGDEFDPNMHNAVMHCEKEELGENVLAEVFQKGFRVGDRVIRFAMVSVAN